MYMEGTHNSNKPRQIKEVKEEKGRTPFQKFIIKQNKTKMKAGNLVKWVGHLLAGSQPKFDP